MIPHATISLFRMPIHVFSAPYKMVRLTFSYCRRTAMFHVKHQRNSSSSNIAAAETALPEEASCTRPNPS